VPSIQMRCNDHGQPASQGHDRLFYPTAPGDRMAHALSQDHFFECIML
jgi:hypothetical protein